MSQYYYIKRNSTFYYWGGDTDPAQQSWGGWVEHQKDATLFNYTDACTAAALLATKNDDVDIQSTGYTDPMKAWDRAMGIL